MSEDGRSRVAAYYGTFQGVPPGHPQQPAMGFPQPVTPPGYVSDPYYLHGYQAVPGYAVAEGRPVREPRLPCCGIGLGWFLFIIGFFLAAIPWYIGAFILVCVRTVDYREKPGYIACALGFVAWIDAREAPGSRGFVFVDSYPSKHFEAVLAAIAVLLGVTKENHHW